MMMWKLSCLFNLFSLVKIIYNLTFHELFVSNSLNNNLHYDFLLGVVLSAVGGVKEATSALTDNTIMWISVAILIILFQVQRFGTDKLAIVLLQYKQFGFFSTKLLACTTLWSMIQGLSRQSIQCILLNILLGIRRMHGFLLEVSSYA